VDIHFRAEDGNRGRVGGNEGLLPGWADYFAWLPAAQPQIPGRTPAHSWGRLCAGGRREAHAANPSKGAHGPMPSNKGRRLMRKDWLVQIYQGVELTRSPDSKGTKAGLGSTV